MQFFRAAIFLLFCSIGNILPAFAHTTEINFGMDERRGATDGAEATNIYADEGVTFPSRPRLSTLDVYERRHGQSLKQGAGTRCTPLEMRFDARLGVMSVAFDMLNRGLRDYSVQAFSGEEVVDEFVYTPRRGPPRLSLAQNITLRDRTDTPAITRVFAYPPTGCFDLVVVDNLRIEHAGSHTIVTPIPDRVFSYSAMEAQPEIKWSGRINDISVNPRNENIVLATAETGGLWRSLDGGIRWKPVTSLPVFELNSVHHLSANPNVILVTALQDFQKIPVGDSGLTTSGGGIWLSRDSGHTWNQPIEAIPAYAGRSPPRSDQFCPANTDAWEVSEDPETGRVFIGTGCGITFVDGLAVPSRTRWTHKFFSVSNAHRDRRSFRAVAALVRNGVIAGNGETVFSSLDNGLSWSEAKTNRASMLPPVQDLHAAATHPNLPDAAFMVTLTSRTDSTPLLWFSNNAGATWTRIFSVPGGGGGCGGIAHIYVRANPDASKAFPDLYFGNRCATFTAEFDLTNVSTRTRWRSLEPSHGDTRALAFAESDRRFDIDTPIFLASDGGLDRLSGTVADAVWTPIGSGVDGINALQLYDVQGQLLSDTGGYIVAIGSQDNWLWSSDDEMTWPETQTARAEGGNIQMSRRSLSSTDDTWSFFACADCFNKKSFPLFSGVSNWPGYASLGNRWKFSSPIKINRNINDGVYIQNLEKTNTDGRKEYYMAVTRDYGRTYRSRVPYDIARPLRNYPRPAPGASFYQAYVDSFYTEKFQELDQSLRHTRLRYYPAGLVGNSEPAMNGFGSIGHFAFQFAWNAVFDVNPLDRDDLIAPDVENRNILRSRDGGENWEIIRGLKEIVTEDDRFELARPYFGNVSLSLVSRISYFPENPDMILLGLQQGGAYISQDGGENWTHVSGSERIPNITDFEWKSADEIYVSSYGRGLWKFFKTAWRIDLSLLADALVRPATDIPLLRNIEINPEKLAFVPVIQGSNRLTRRWDQSVKIQLRDALKLRQFDKLVLAVDGHVTGHKAGSAVEDQIATSPGTTIYTFERNDTANPSPTVSPKLELQVNDVASSSSVLGIMTVGLAFRDNAIVGKVVGPIISHKKASDEPAKPRESTTLSSESQSKASYVVMPSNVEGVLFENGIIDGARLMTVLGYNFASGTTVALSIDGEPISKAQPDNKGRFTGVLKAPNLGRGYHQLEVVQQLDGNQERRSFEMSFLVRHFDKD